MNLALEAFRRGRDGAPRIVGHRGVRGDGAPPENTIDAFEKAFDEGADAIELDVRLCKTGEPVVVHDATLARATAGADTRSVADLSPSELAAIDLGGGAAVPTLAQVLAFARSRRRAVNVEMKRDVPDRTAVVAAVARLLASWDPRHRVIVSSFDPAMLLAFAALAPSRPRALIVHRTRWHRVAALVAAPAVAHAVHLERTIASPDLVASARARGLVVHAWTVNHAVEARDLAAIGVDGLITDAPAEMRAALA